MEMASWTFYRTIYQPEQLAVLGNIERVSKVKYSVLEFQKYFTHTDGFVFTLQCLCVLIEHRLACLSLHYILWYLASKKRKSEQLIVFWIVLQ